MVLAACAAFWCPEAQAQIPGPGALVQGTTFESIGVPPVLTGTCAVVASTQSGGASAGQFAVPAGNCATTTTVIMAMPTAKNGWACDAHNLNTPTSIWDQTAVSTTSVTLTIRSANSTAADVVAFKCMAY
jgi:hypothetical protein